MTNTHIKYVSILSVIDDVHSMISSVDWDEDNVIEWALKGYKATNLPASFEDNVVFVPITNHAGMLPADTVHINQMFYREYPTVITQEDIIQQMAEITGCTPDKPFYKQMAHVDEFLERISKNNCFNSFYKELRRSSSSFGVEPCHEGKVPNSGCLHLYQVNNFVINTTFKEGCIILSYKRFFVDDKGYFMIPDDEDLKQALFHFVVYRMFLSRAMAKEEGTFQMAEYHRNRYLVHARKAKGQLTLPDLDLLENITNNMSRLVPRSNFYERAFSNLSNRENINF